MKIRPLTLFLFAISSVFALAPGILCPPDIDLVEGFQAFGWMFVPASLFAWMACRSIRL